MNLIFLNINFEAVSAPIDDYTSCVFTPCYYSAGVFSIVLGCDKYQYVKNAAYVYNDETGEAGIIGSITYTDTLSVSGRLFEAILDMRVINDTINISGEIETVIRSLVTKYAITSPRTITGLTLGDTAGFTDIVETQPKPGTTLSDAIRTIIIPGEISYTCDFDYINSLIKFRLYKGFDRTQAQTVNSWAVFSTDYENLINPAYRRNSVDYKNYAYVIAGNDDNYGHVAVEIDNVVSGDVRRELYVDASSIKSKDDDGSVMTLEAYTAVLIAYGKAVLADYSLVETVEGEVDGGGSLIYRRDYNVGDLCDIVLTDLGLVWSARITELDEVYENGSVRYVPRFGDGRLTLREFIRREIK